MSDRLETLVRRIALGSLATLIPGAATADEVPAAAERTIGVTTASDAAWPQVLRAARPRLVLIPATAGAAPSLLTSHRSHRSHSSHRSHYSSRSSPRPAPAPPPKPAQRAEAESVTSSRLGSRVLIKGMRGPDVGELMLLLVKRGHLAAKGINTDQLFTSTVEEAVKAFQRANLLPQDGRVTAAVLMLLKTEK